jgi:DNA-binding CsgD family transcriptional regulator
MVGRERELAAVRRVVATGDGPVTALVLEGDPGIGKTTLWDAGVDLARQNGRRVLVARGSGAETGLAFAALIDLLDGVAAEELDALPGPQRRALDVALYRADPTGDPPEAHAIALGLLSALRTLATNDRLLLAIDDMQWLDRASEEALAYAVRRLEGTTDFLLARRPGRPTLLEQAFRAGSLHHLAVTSPGLGATRRILADRLGLRLPHHLLRRVFDTTLGNPLFALEVGRLVAGRDVATLREDLPVPDDIDEVLGMRVGDLESPARRVLLAVALDADLRAAQLIRLAGPSALDSAIQEGVVVLDRDRVRPAHPLLAAAVKSRASEPERAGLHRELADVAADEQGRALHLALATRVEDDALGAVVASAADTAAARGAAQQAVVLAGHALRLTSPTGSAYVERLLALAGHLKVAGEKQRLTELVTQNLGLFPRGAARVRAHVQLTYGVIDGNDEIRRYLEQALTEAADDPALRSPVLSQLAENEAVVRVDRLAEAERWALEALNAAAAATPEERLALYALSWTRSLQGQPAEDLCERFRAVSGGTSYIAESPDRVAGQRLVWRGEIAQAREELTRLLRLADERGEPSSYALQRLHVCELELRVGRWDAAAALLEEWSESGESSLLHWPMYERCQALLAAGRGHIDHARQWGGEALTRAEVTGVRWDWLEARRALGLAELLAKNPEEAAGHLRATWEHTRRAGVQDPGAFPVAPDLVEALVETEALEEAGTVAAVLSEQARSQEHPWGLASAKRSLAVLQVASSGYDDETARELDGAAADYARLGLGFDGGRTLLTLGRAQRRAKKWGAARSCLERAAAAFDQLGSPGWAAEARAELLRVGARRPSSSGQLTTTERRVAELAAEGLANKEIARTLVVTVNTVEFHLRNLYSKLGIRSRAQLAARLAELDVPPGA